MKFLKFVRNDISDVKANKKQQIEDLVAVFTNCYK